MLTNRFYKHSNSILKSIPFKCLDSLRLSFGTSDKYTNYRFVDKIKVEVKGGHGGDGCISFDILSPGKKRPSGGSGGHGGNVYLIADKDVQSLNFHRIHFSAEDGNNGSSKGATGRNGNNTFIKVPVGTIISEAEEPKVDYEDYQELIDEMENNRINKQAYAQSTIEESLPTSPEAFSEANSEEIIDEVDDEEGDDDDDGGEEGDEEDTFDDSFEMKKKVVLLKHKDIVLVAVGGRAGVGNQVLAGSKSKRQRSLPLTKIPGTPGQVRVLQLEMKVIADVGLVGYPNAGKSSLLRAISNAIPKVAEYPFTTLYPNVGVVEYSDCYQVSIADIPGLIEGAHENRGLGHDFLKHIERTKILLFVLDISGADKKKPLQNLKELIKELQFYDEKLLYRPMAVFVNKTDLKEYAKNLEELTRYCAKMDVPLIHGSTMTGEGIPSLAHKLRHMVTEDDKVEDYQTIESKYRKLTPEEQAIEDEKNKQPVKRSARKKRFSSIEQ